MVILSDRTLDFLLEADWFEGREIDLTRYKDLLNNEGFVLSVKARDFLERFGGLKVTHPHAKVSGQTDSFHFNVELALDSRDPAWVKEYSKRIGKELCPIGEAFRRHMVLAMDPSGAVYAGFDDILVFVEESGEEAIEAMCSGKEPSKVVPRKKQ